MLSLSKNYKIWFSVSGLFIVVGLVMMLVMGLNYGIDFTGGTMLHFGTSEVVNPTDVSNTLAEFDLSPEIQHSGVGNLEVIVKTSKPLDNKLRQEIFDKLSVELPVKGHDFLSVEQFGPAMGEEIRNKAIVAISIASVLMLIYISLRFEPVFGISAIISLLHDVFFLISAYSIFRFQVNSTFIAAILTVVGYSINDTIVIFDRIREDKKSQNSKDHFAVAEDSVRLTIRRTINTSLTTLLAIVSLYIFGTETLKEFALPLLIGISVGTYSSIFIASSVWALIRNNISKKGKYQSK